MASRTKFKKKSSLPKDNSACTTERAQSIKKKWSFLIKILTVLFCVYVAVILTLRYSQRLQSGLIYMNFVNLPMFVNLSRPMDLGLNGTVNFRLTHDNGCHIGVWHVLPGIYGGPDAVAKHSALLGDGSIIVLYLHGNTGNRAMHHRIQLYKYLSKERNYHVVTFDYRGFGDSNCTASEEGLMEDSLLVWQWIRGHAPEAEIYIWGHSLGASACTHLTARLASDNISPSGILLDAPFTNITEAAESHPFGLPFWILGPYFRYFMLSNLYETHKSVDRLPKITCPILIMHGQNDIIIPFRLGKKMYEAALATRSPSSGEVVFVDCGDTAHKTNYVSPELRKVLDSFIKFNKN